jgi:hypothetical protein
VKSSSPYEGEARRGYVTPSNFPLGPCPNILSVAYNVTLNSPAGGMKGLKLHAARLFRRKFCIHNFRLFVAEFSLSDFRFFASLRMTFFGQGSPLPRGIDGELP